MLNCVHILMMVLLEAIFKIEDNLPVSIDNAISIVLYLDDIFDHNI